MKMKRIASPAILSSIGYYMFISRSSRDPKLNHELKQEFSAKSDYVAPMKGFVNVCISKIIPSQLNVGNNLLPSVAAYTKEQVMDEKLRVSYRLTSREKRFIKFASIEYHGQLFMTPRDFLESVTNAEPRPRVKRRVLSDDEIDAFNKAVPELKKNNSKMFRKLHDTGLVSYIEYLFFLSILTKPKSGFRIAFNMFDTDGNERVDKNEFLVMCILISIHNWNMRGSDNLEKVFSETRASKIKKQQEKLKSNPLPENLSLPEEMSFLQGDDMIDTTLMVHFFGKKGKTELKFGDFKTFMENLQNEVLEMEFHEFSKGLNTISELDFAKILLRYTHLTADQYEVYLERLMDRIKIPKGVTFEDFRSFCQFLNNLEDFAIAMRMYTLADHPISQDEFNRAVKICTGDSLSKELVNTVFQIFDDDGDGQLSYKEFIAIMKDRLHRGIKHSTKTEGFEAFKSCMKSEMRAISV